MCKDAQSLKIEILLFTKQSTGLFTVYSIHRAPMGIGDRGSWCKFETHAACCVMRNKAICLWSRNLLSLPAFTKLCQAYLFVSIKKYQIILSSWQLELISSSKVTTWSTKVEFNCNKLTGKLWTDRSWMVSAGFMHLITRLLRRPVFWNRKWSFLERWRQFNFHFGDKSWVSNQMSMKGMISLICGTEKNKGTKITKQKQTHRYKLVVSRVEEGWGKGQNGWRGLKSINYYV